MDLRMCQSKNSWLHWHYRLIPFDWQIPKARRGLWVITEESFPVLAARLKSDIVSYEELEALFRLAADTRPKAVVEYLPSLIVDLDDKLFVDQYYEPFGFSQFVPAGWTVEEDTIESRVPPHLKYWD